ncbi:hypothetical protein [Hyalangium versicolor]|uniref:hypothetical protein n=1 Tax=Hyalangium versicolor TaxID=2861190 RepID=UPI001CCFDE60|nr:hypothetical protein [Hyalangium versicolor]
MPVARNPGSTSLVDILDRVLDQGIRFEERPHAALAAAHPPLEQGRIVIAAVETHLEPPGASPGKTGTGV